MSFRALFLGLLLCMGYNALTAMPKTGTDTKTNRIEFYYGIAEGNYLIGDLSGAERGIEQILRINPDHIPALTLKARIQLDQNQHQFALEGAKLAQDLEPEKQEHRLLEALILAKMDRIEDATTLILSVIKLSPKASEDAQAARQLLGLLRMAEGEWDQAATAFNDIYLSDPTIAVNSLRLTSEAYLEKASALLSSNDFTGAIAAIDQAIAVYPDNTGKESLQQRTALRMMRARVLVQAGKGEAAISDLQTLTGQQRDNFEALITLASIYASVERWGSLEALIPTIATRPELQDVALYLEGRAALAKNRVGTARAKFQAAIEALSNDNDSLRPTLYFYRGVCLEQLKRSKEAEELILNAIDAGFRPETSSEALLAGRVLLRADRASNAIPLLEAVTLNQISPRADVWAMLGRAHQANNTSTLAISAFNESLRIDPKQSDTLALRGSLLRKMGDLEGALADYTNAHQLIPNSPVLSYEQGLLRLQLGRIDEAETFLRMAARELDAQSKLELLHASCAYTVGKDEHAKESLIKYWSATHSSPEPSAHYLAWLLKIKTPVDYDDPVIDYFAGKSDRKAVIDWAGRAETPKQAAKQICSTAFWMAQHEKARFDHDQATELLKIAVEIGQINLAEHQFAQWQLQDPH